MFEPKIETITEVKWNGENEVEIHCGSTVWCGSKRKDFWNPDSDWESRIKAGIRIRYWTIQYSLILGFEIEENGKWVSVWCKANNFQSGNTYGCALNYGISHSENKEKAEIVRQEHNLKYDVEGGVGVVNPAILTIGLSQ